MKNICVRRIFRKYFGTGILNRRQRILKILKSDGEMEHTIMDSNKNYQNSQNKNNQNSQNNNQNKNNQNSQNNNQNKNNQNSQNKK